MMYLQCTRCMKYILHSFLLENSDICILCRLSRCFCLSVFLNLYMSCLILYDNCTISVFLVLCMSKYCSVCPGVWVYVCLNLSNFILSVWVYVYVKINIYSVKKNIRILLQQTRKCLLEQSPRTSYLAI